MEPNTCRSLDCRIGSSRVGFFLCLIVFLSSFDSISAAEIPFQVGEKLEYSLKWGLIPVGSAQMEILPNRTYGGENCHAISFSVRTNKFADAFYKVRTSILSLVSEDFDRSILYSKDQQEGKTKKKITVNYDYEKSIAKYQEGSEEPRFLNIDGNVFDPLAIAYLFRLKPLVEGGRTILPTCDGKRFREVVVETGKVQNVRVPFGNFKVVGTSPELKNLSGVFKKSPDGMLRVWYSTDYRRIPIRISSKVVVGSFTASLVKATGLRAKK